MVVAMACSDHSDVLANDDDGTARADCCRGCASSGVAADLVKDNGLVPLDFSLS